ncbi:phenylalanyl-tRNA synthetase [Gonapodya prolifera JEL478]|uniref:phenylalanine--tRNA ligase n=1 Tax=Gonapodya prolifera (strain JEL478) TaxID=1344416 RepID=A0A139AYB9_GONPJ|nr:phenylalanyl-tRNA synthetase [Gonapodya prolifera JEL478]|eukprot:KXS21742.1 phenylalanyl-tRNA synthetase [Gonapodya prolifera JEL478]
MPSITVDKLDLYDAIGTHYSYDEFFDLCFEFGIELEEETSERESAEEEGLAPEKLAQLSDRRVFKIDIPANRYDMLCPEGLSRALRVFVGNGKPPSYRLVEPKERQKIYVAKEVSSVRPVIVGAILRNITFTPARYKSFIDLQEKLHGTLARKRTLASIGTHDLDTVKGPFEYVAVEPTKFSFIPLNQEKEMNGAELMEHYSADRHIGRFLHIIRDFPVYPLVRTRAEPKTILSLPPIINGDYTKIHTGTRNVLIEITATDQNKADIVLKVFCAMFSQYCDDPFTVEPVDIIYPTRTHTTPDLSVRHVPVHTSYINSCLGLTLSAAEISSLLNRMCLPTNPLGEEMVEVQVGPTRSDVLHPCDVMEDVGIAYGFNKLTRVTGRVATIGAGLPISSLSDAIRRETALAGWTEALPLILCSIEENFNFLNLKDNNQTAVKLANPKTIEYQVVRTSLLPGLLKTVASNLDSALPIKIFEVSDVAFKDDTVERRARNERRMAALYVSRTSGFEYVHGLLDRLMQVLGAKNVASGAPNTYYIRESTHPTYFPGRAADVVYGGQVIGNVGVLHPDVVKNFGLPYAVSALEMQVEPFL